MISNIHKDKVFGIAKKEYMDNVRNKWMITLTVIFLILTLVISYFSLSATATSIGEVTPKGEWNASMNVPLLGDNGEGGASWDAYVVSVGGNVTFDGVEIQWMPGDWVVNIGDSWQRLSFAGVWDASSNFPPLGDNGANGTNGDLYMVAVAGNTSLDGNSAWEVNNVLVNYEGTWIKIEAPDIGVGFKGFESTVLGMVSITSILLPIIAIMLGYGTIIGERENGSLSVVLSCPVSREDVVIGKFIGLGAVLFTTIFVGMGVSGLIIGLMATSAKWTAYILFMFGTFIFTMVFLGFAILMSTLAKKRSTAMGGGIFLWFSGMIIGIIVMGVWAAMGGDFSELMTGNIQFPDWVWIVEHLSFMDTYQMGGMLLFGITQFQGFSMDSPEWMTATSTFAWLLLMAILSFLATLWLMRKKDI